MQSEVYDARNERNYTKLKEYIKLGMYDVNHVSDGHHSELTLACYDDCSEMVKFLLANNADPDLSDGLGDYPITTIPMLIPAQCFSVEIAQLLANAGASLNTKGSHGNTLAHIAVSCYDWKMLEFLCCEKANLFAKNEYGQTPIDIALAYDPNNSNYNATKMYEVLVNHCKTIYGDNDIITVQLLEIFHSLNGAVYVKPTKINNFA
jgi:ankyrin repeat protein